MSKEKDAFHPPKSETDISYKTRIAKLLDDQLTKFEVNAGNLDDADWHRALQGIAASKKLRTLVINDVVDDKRAEQLAAALGGNQSLTSVTIISSLMTTRGEDTLAKALVQPEHPNLLEAIVHSGLGTDQFGNVSHLQDRLADMVESNTQLANRMANYDADRPSATEELERRANAIEAMRQKSSAAR